MRKALFALCLVLLAAGLSAQPQFPTAPQTPQNADPVQIIEDVRFLFIARTLRLREDQKQSILPLLNKAQERLQQQKAALDSLWAEGQGLFAAVDQALLAGQRPAAAQQTQLQRIIQRYEEIRAQTDKDLEQIGLQILALLDSQQRQKVEPPQARPANAPRRQHALEIAANIARYAIAMRQLLPEEYEALRVPLALRLAALLVPPEERGYNMAVGDVLRILDSVRRLTDAQFAQVEPQLTGNIASALRLAPAAPENPQYALSFEEYMEFVTHPRSAALLAEMKAEPAMEVKP